MAQHRGSQCSSAGLLADTGPGSVSSQRSEDELSQSGPPHLLSLVTAGVKQSINSRHLLGHLNLNTSESQLE